MSFYNTINVPIKCPDPISYEDKRELNYHRQRQKVAHEVPHAIIHHLCQVIMNTFAVRQQAPLLEEGLRQVNLQEHRYLINVILVGKAHVPLAVVLLLVLEDLLSTLHQAFKDAVNFFWHHEDQQDHADVLQVVTTVFVVVLPRKVGKDEF